jgi:hypothetical protein
MNDFVIGWTCPDCSTPQKDSFFKTAAPVCYHCGLQADWSDLVSARLVAQGHQYMRDYFERQQPFPSRPSWSHDRPALCGYHDHRS